MNKINIETGVGLFIIAGLICLAYLFCQTRRRQPDRDKRLCCEGPFFKHRRTEGRV